MAIINNKNTAQSLMTTAGRTGTQVTKFIDAPRVYVKSADSISAAPVQTYFNKSNGVTPATWTDLGQVIGSAKVTYNKKSKDVTTGIDEVLRASYVGSKDVTIEATLGQFDDVVLEQLSGLTASVITSGSIVSYAVGSEDLIQLALLLVVQNKLDGKEWQFYNPAAYLNYSFEASGDALAVKMTGKLPFFTPQGGTKEQFIAQTMFA